MYYIVLPYHLYRVMLKRLSAREFIYSELQMSIGGEILVLG